MPLFFFLTVRYFSERLSGYLLLNYPHVANRNKTSGEVSAKAKAVRLNLLPFSFSLQTLTAPAPFADETSCQCQAPHEKLTIAQARLGTPGEAVLLNLRTGPVLTSQVAERPIIM